MSNGRPASNEIEIFREELSENMKFLKENLKKISDDEDMLRAEGICKYYETYGTLTAKQEYAAMMAWREVQNARF